MLFMEGAAPWEGAWVGASPRLHHTGVLQALLRKRVVAVRLRRVTTGTGWPHPLRWALSLGWELNT